MENFDTIRTTLRTLGLDEFWDHQFNYTKMNHLKLMVEKGPKDLHIQALRDQTVDINKCPSYRSYGSEYKCEKCFSDLPLSLGIYFSRFICMNHRLPIEYGRVF